MKNFKDPFEEFIRNSLERQEVKYNPGHWEELEQRLDSLSTPVSNKSKFFQNSLLLKSIGALVVASIISYVTFDYFSKEKVQKEITETVGTNQKEQVIALNSADAAAPANVKEENNAAASDLNPSTVNDNLKQEESLASLAANEVKKENSLSKQEVPVTANLTELNSTSKSAETVAAKPNLNFTMTEVTGCEQLLTSFTIVNPDKNYTYKWELGDGTILEGTNPQHLYTTTGVYDVKLIAESKSDHKKYVNTQIAAVAVYEKPKAEFDFNDTQLGTFKFEANFYDLSEGAVDWKWSFGDNNQSTLQSPKHIYTSKGNKVVELIVKNTHGCVDAAKRIISIEDRFFTQNSFTPDGDGVNDNFIPKALEISDLPFEFSIFDPAKNLVYKTDDKNKPWNGKNNNSGDVYPVGSIFFWSVKIKDANGTEQNYIGNVSIVKSN